VIFIYVRSLTNRRFSLRFSHFLHLLPFLLFEILAFTKHLPFSPGTILEPGPGYLYRIAFISANLVSWIIYMPLSIIIVHRHRVSLKNEVSNIESNETLGWLLFITIFYVLYCLAIFATGATEIFSQFTSNATQITNYSILLALVYIISFYGLRQKELTKLFNPKMTLLVKTYKNSVLSDNQRSVIKEKIIAYFKDKKPYLDPSLNMDSMSEALNIPKYQLTEVLNRELGKNFFQWVNHYRVDAVKTMLSDKSMPYSIEATGYECGFSSKSSFYSFFKSETGMTPSEYREKALKANSRV